MKSLCLLLAVLLTAPAVLWAEPTPTPTPDLGFEKPLSAEREANGFDPEGMEYRQNRLEDFQIIFIETAPFAALVSYGLTALVSYSNRRTAKLDKTYFACFIGGTVLLSAGAAYYAVSGKPYPPKTPDMALLVPPNRLAAFQTELFRYSF
jgi:hypothetical protein